MIGFLLTKLLCPVDFYFPISKQNYCYQNSQKDLSELYSLDVDQAVFETGVHRMDFFFFLQ